MSDRVQVVKSFFFLVLKRGWGGILNVFVLSYVARQLDREDFGLLAIASSFLHIVQQLMLSGISTYVIHRTAAEGSEEEKQEVALAAFWLNILLALGVIAIVGVGASYWADFYDEPQIATILYWLLVSFFFSQLGSIPIALLRRDFRYERFIPIQMIIGTLSQLFQAALAWKGYGVYALVYPGVVFMPIQSAVILYLSPLRLKWRLYRRHWKSIIGYTKFVVFSVFLNSMVSRADSLIIGKLLGEGPLGLYDIARRFATIFSGHFMPMVGSVFLPLLSKYRHDFHRFRSHFRRMVQMITVVAVGVAALQIAFAPEIIIGMPGPQWKAAIPLFALFSMQMMMKMVSSPSTQVYYALGYPQIGTYFVIAFSAVFFPALYWASHIDILTVGLVVVGLQAIGSPVHFIIISRLLKSKVWELYGFTFLWWLIGSIQAWLLYLLTPYLLVGHKMLIAAGLVVVQGWVLYRWVLREEFRQTWLLIQTRLHR